MVICNLGKRYLFIALTTLAIILVLVLTELTASICAKTVQVTTVCQCHRMSLTARYRDDFLII